MVVVLAMAVSGVAAARGDEGYVDWAPSSSNGGPPPERQFDFGAGNVHYSAVDSISIKPWKSTSAYFHSSSTGIFCSPASTDTRFIGQIVMPHGVHMNAFRFWLYDLDSTEKGAALNQSSCLPDSVRTRRSTPCSETPRRRSRSLAAVQRRRHRPARPRA